MSYSVLEICAGGGGQALGLEQAGFEPVAVVENDPHCCATLRLNRPSWNVCEQDVHDFSALQYGDVDLLAGGVPCPPFSIAGKQLGSDDERDLFPQALRLVEEARPKAVMLENVRGLLSAKFDDYRSVIQQELIDLGYLVDWKLLQASDFGVPQLRPRAIMVAIRSDQNPFQWPDPSEFPDADVYSTISDLLKSDGWRPSDNWIDAASKVAPTIVGGSKKHGGPDLGPTRAKKAWAELGVDGKGIANGPPIKGQEGMPRLTVPMVARIQGFPDSWQFSGKKTAAYRQVGNAFPPPVAAAVARQIALALKSSKVRATG